MSVILKIAVMMCLLVTSAFTNPSAIGTWKTIDDETGKEKSLVEIFESNGVLKGKIVKLFRNHDEDQNPKCDKCSGDKKDQPLIGLEILWDLKASGNNRWADGEIMDPKKGKIYSCKIELIENGKKLKVRGFMGFSLLGRTQVWEKQEEAVN